MRVIQSRLVVTESQEADQVNMSSSASFVSLGVKLGLQEVLVARNVAVQPFLLNIFSIPATVKIKCSIPSESETIR